MERMKEAYGILYLIETSLRQYIEDEMISRYGPKWKRTDSTIGFKQRPLGQSKFYQLENYLRIYNFKLPRDFIPALRKIYQIRNDIAHCVDLTEEQYQILEESFEKIMDVLASSKVH